MDMHSGGGLKEKHQYIFIEAPEKEAEIIFYNRFGHSPSRVSCTCCGEDYSVGEHEDLAQATAYERGCHYAYVHKKTGKEIPQSEGFISGEGVKRGYEGKYVERASDRSWGPGYQTLEEFLSSRKDVLVIYEKDIKPEERVGEIPAQGYVWVD
jgi:hypothetical protein